MKNLTLTFLAFIISLNGISQLTYVPDDNFEKYIETLSGSTSSNGVVNDNYVLTSGLDAWTSLNFGIGLDVSDLTGIQDFKKLKSITFNSSTIVNIDLSNVTLTPSMYSPQGVDIIGCNYLQSVKLPHGENYIRILGAPYLSNIEFPSDFISKTCEVQGCYSLTSFDISSINDVKLNSRLNLESNNLKCIKLNNGKCNKWAEVTIKSNNSTCIQVDDPSFCQIGESVGTWDWDGYSLGSNQYSTNCNCIAGLDNKETSRLSFAPNPTSSEVKITLTQDQLGKSFKLFDNIGKEKMSGMFTSTNYFLNLESFEAGIYFLKIAEEDAQIKIVKN